MKALVNTRNQLTLVSDVREARSMWSRMKGLLGLSGLPREQALWIHQCNSVHTFFMKFAIDLVFVNSRFEVKAVYYNVPPWRLIAPIWGASSVFELAGGTLTPEQISIGDVLNVRA